MQKIIGKQQEIERKFSVDGPLGRFIQDLKLLFSILQDYVKGDYRKVPWMSIAAIVAALVYVIDPLDLVPDTIPVLGLVDDAFMLAACLKMIVTDLELYKNWKEKQLAAEQEQGPCN